MSIAREQVARRAESAPRLKQPRRLLLWATLGGGAGIFLAVGIGLLIVCLRHDERVSAPSFAEVPSAVALDRPPPAQAETSVPQPEQTPKPSTEVTPPAQAAILPALPSPVASAKPDAVPVAANLKAAATLVLAWAKVEPPADNIAASKGPTGRAGSRGQGGNRQGGNPGRSGH